MQLQSYNLGYKVSETDMTVFPEWQPTRGYLQGRRNPAPFIAFGATRNKSNAQPSISSWKWFSSGPFAPPVEFVQLKKTDGSGLWNQMCF